MGEQRHEERDERGETVLKIGRLGDLLTESVAVRSVMITGLFIMAAVFMLAWAEPVVLPFVLAVLLSFLLMPLVRWMKHLGIPEAAGAGVVLLGFTAALVVGIVLLVEPAVEWVERAPQTLRRVEFKLREIQEPIQRVSEAVDRVEAMAEEVTEGGGEEAGDADAPDQDAAPIDPGEPGTLDEALEAVQEAADGALVPPSARDELAELDEAAEAAREVVAPPPAEPAPASAPGRTSLSEVILTEAGDFVSTTVIVVILLYFLLASGDLFLRKLVKVQPKLRDKKRAVDIVHEIQTEVSRYLFTISIINVLQGVAIGIALHLLGMPNAVLWGAMAALLNFVPILGAVVGTVVVAVVAIVTFDDLAPMLLVPFAYWAITALEGYLVTPYVLGMRLTLNPVVVFGGLVFWGWLWGIPGAILAVPLISAFKIICDHVEPLRPVGEFLSR